MVKHFIILSSKDYKEFLLNSGKNDLNRLSTGNSPQISQTPKDSLNLINSALQDLGIFIFSIYFENFKNLI
jgi:hypothetical protein